MTNPAKGDFADLSAELSVTPEEEEYFRELEMKAKPRPARLPEPAMTYDQYLLYLQTQRGASHSRFAPRLGF